MTSRPHRQRWQPGGQRQGSRGKISFGQHHLLISFRTNAHMRSLTDSFLDWQVPFTFGGDTLYISYLSRQLDYTLTFSVM